MGNYYQSTVIFLECLLQDVLRADVHVVGRLIKRQKVVGLEHQLCHRKTSPLTSAEHGHLLVYVLPLEKEGGKYIPEFQSDVSNCNPV